MKNDSAFPSKKLERTGPNVEHWEFVMSPGLTKREYFAGQALFAHLWLNRDVRNPGPNLAQMIAIDAVACADALIAELEKGGEIK